MTPKTDAQRAPGPVVRRTGWAERKRRREQEKKDRHQAVKDALAIIPKVEKKGQTAMKASVPPELEQGRVTSGPLGSHAGYGMNGAFKVRHAGKVYLLIVSDGGGWEHASVEVVHARRCPTWEEMCFVKDLLWAPTETVVQYHPAKENYVNVHPYVLHLWRPPVATLPTPPVRFV
jgi:hypothetical protein